MACHIRRLHRARFPATKTGLPNRKAHRAAGPTDYDPFPAPGSYPPAPDRSARSTHETAGCVSPHIRDFRAFVLRLYHRQQLHRPNPLSATSDSPLGRQLYGPVFADFYRTSFPAWGGQALAQNGGQNDYCLLFRPSTFMGLLICEQLSNAAHTYSKILL